MKPVFEFVIGTVIVLVIFGLLAAVYNATIVPSALSYPALQEDGTSTMMLICGIIPFAILGFIGFIIVLLWWIRK